MKIPPFELERFLTLHEFNAPYPLCNSDCESISVRELLDLEPGSREALEKFWLGYTEAPGGPVLREAIARSYRDINAGQVLVHAGAGEAIFTFMNTALNAGDHVIVQWPCYQSLFQLPATLGCEVTKWESNPEKGWELDMEFLKQAIKKNTKAIVVNCPHNPTGYLMPRSHFDELVKLASHHGIILFVDEVYKGLEYVSSDELPFVCDVYENGVSLGVTSKSYGLAGLRIGWVATRNQNILSQMGAFKDYTSICNSGPSEFLATIALNHREKIIGRNRGLILKNLKTLDEFMSRHKNVMSWVRPRAGCIGFPRVSIAGFAENVLTKAGILLAPGSKFSFSDEYVRIGFGRASFVSTLQRLENFLITAAT